MNLVIPAVLPSSRKELSDKLAIFAGLGAEKVQIDVVDGKFATPPSWPYTAPLEFERMVKRGEMLPNFDTIAYEVDLMCLDTDRAAAGWLTLGARRLTFHAESMQNAPEHLKRARARYAGDIGGELVSFGIALNIASDLALLEPCLPYVDYVQFMGIASIGKQGQPFDERVLSKIRVFRNKHSHMPVQVDGGVSLVSAKKLVAIGVTNLVIGSAILRASDPVKAIADFEALHENGGVY